MELTLDPKISTVKLPPADTFVTLGSNTMVAEKAVSICTNPKMQKAIRYRAIN